MNSSLSGGNTPNIASVYGDYVAGFMKAGATLVMNDYISNSDYGLGKSVDADGKSSRMPPLLKAILTNPI